MVAVVTALLVTAPPRQASAQDAPADAIAQIRELMFQARFDDAQAAAEGLLGRADLDAGQRNAALEVLATAQIAQRQRGPARETLARLYARDPGHTLADPDASPPVIAAFARAREDAPDPVPVTVAHTPPTLTRRESPQIVARVTEGADAVAEVRLIYRSGGDEGRVVMSRRGDGTYEGRVPVVGAASASSEVTYYLVALAPSQTPLGQLGSEAEPMRLTVPAGASGGVAQVDPEDERPPALQGLGTHEETPGDEDGGGGSVAEEWWFWTLLAVLVVGGGVTAGVLLGTQGGGPEQGTLGVGQLTLFEL